MKYEERLEVLENKGKQRHLNYSRNFRGFGVRRPRPGVYDNITIWRLMLSHVLNNFCFVEKSNHT